MSIYQKSLADRAPEMNATHMLTLAYEMSSKLNGQSKAFFDRVADTARKMGAVELAALHAEVTA
jgi:hypothetical protein|tara:strand:+ start:219 stop:410 length:192 start_codon:yes stop_codon:yes gene_type:complete